jgi:hypothetical protein
MEYKIIDGILMYNHKKEDFFKQKTLNNLEKKRAEKQEKLNKEW